MLPEVNMECSAYGKIYNFLFQRAREKFLIKRKDLLCCYLSILCCLFQHFIIWVTRFLGNNPSISLRVCAILKEKLVNVRKSGYGLGG